MRRALPLFAITCLLVACGGDEDDKQAATAPTPPAESTAPATAPSAPSAGGDRTEAAPDDPEATTGDDTSGAPAPSATGRQARRTCLRGSWVSSSFKGKRSFDSPFGQIALSGRGRGLGLSFEGRRWTFNGVGERPMRGSALGIEGTLKVNGSARGRLVPTPGGGVRFRQLGTRGTVTLAGLGSEFDLPVSVVAAAIVPDGPAEVRCGGGRLVIDSRSGVLRLTD